MKPHGTLVFILSCFALLAVLCLVYPENGIRIGGRTLRFATLENVLTSGNRPDTPDIDSLELKRREERFARMRGFYDTLVFYRDYISDSTLGFSLPDNDIHFFDGFFAKAEEARSEGRTLRILHYGDSQIEMDHMTDTLRSYMQETFGGGGVGLIPFSQTIPSLSVSQYASGAITLYSSYGEYERNNGNYGPMAKCCRLGGSATCNITAGNSNRCNKHLRQFSEITILFNNLGGNFTATVGDEQQTCSEPGIHTLSWKLRTTTKTHVSVSGSADIYGIMVDDGGGVAVDNISMRGASGHQICMINKSQQRESYALMNIGLIILQYGGNSVPYLNSPKPIETYAEAMEQQIKRLQETCPEATIVFIGPSDMCSSVDGDIQSYPHLHEVVAALKKMSLENGVAYWSLYDVMGGRNSMVSWVNKGLAGADYLHYSQKGADKMGGYLGDAFAKMYEIYLKQKEIGPEKFDKLWKKVLNQK